MRNIQKTKPQSSNPQNTGFQNSSNRWNRTSHFFVIWSFEVFKFLVLKPSDRGIQNEESKETRGLGSKRAEDFRKTRVLRIRGLRFRFLYVSHVKPFEINIPLELWEKDENRTPVRPQSSTKEVALKENLDEMLASGVIERSGVTVIL